MTRLRRRGIGAPLAGVGLWALAVWIMARGAALAQTTHIIRLPAPAQLAAAGLDSSAGQLAQGTPSRPGLRTPGPLAASNTSPTAPETPAAETFEQPPLALPWGPFSASAASPRSLLDDAWAFQPLPKGVIYRSYLAGVRESRFASAWNYERRWGWMWDIALGGHVGMLRYGNDDPLQPEGFQADIEGAGFPRLDLERDLDLVASDFRFGIPLTYGRGRYQTKLAYYHLSSHLGDEFMLRSAGWTRINYVRNALVWGHSYYLTDNLRLYAEAAWSFDADGGAEPWEFQFGADYSPAEPMGTLGGAPFLAFNVHLREELDFGGNFVVQSGWQWRGATGNLFRMGMQYFVGKSEQYELFRQYEDKIGLGLWYDF